MGAKDPLYGLNWAALVCPLLLPVSFLWDLVSYWSLLASYWLARGATTHEDKVRGVQDQVIIFYAFYESYLGGFKFFLMMIYSLYLL